MIMQWIWIYLSVTCTSLSRNCMSTVSMSFKTEKECDQANKKFNVNAKCEKRRVYIVEEMKR